MPRSSLLACGWVLVACSGGDPSGGPDATVRRDATEGVDTGQPPTDSGGTRPDGSAPFDAGFIPGPSCSMAATSVENGSSGTLTYTYTEPGHAVDGSGVLWMAAGEERRFIRLEGDQVACFSGGAIDGGMPEDAYYECTTEHCGGTCPSTCVPYHSAGGLAPGVSALQYIEDVEIRHSGDGVSLDSETTGNVIARRLYLHDLHDDAFESDFGTAGFTIEDCLVERTYVGFAMRLRSSASGDQTGQLWDIRNNLVLLHRFTHSYREGAGHGNVFKLDESANEPRFQFHDNMIVFGPVAGGSSLVPPVSRVESCANNVYLFVGTAADLDTTLRGDTHPDGGNNGERIAALNGRFAGCIDVRSKPAGTTVDAFLAAEGWTARVAAWRASHVAGATGL